MISVKIQSDNKLVIQVKKNLNKVDFERISLYIESLIDNNSQATIQFFIGPNSKKKSKKEIKAYCELLPYNYLIN